jgi:hypothetical protein
VYTLDLLYMCAVCRVHMLWLAVCCNCMVLVVHPNSGDVICLCQEDAEGSVARAELSMDLMAAIPNDLRLLFFGEFENVKLLDVHHFASFYSANFSQ